jgi:hypothetical protein
MVSIRWECAWNLLGICLRTAPPATAASWRAGVQPGLLFGMGPAYSQHLLSIHSPSARHMRTMMVAKVGAGRASSMNSGVVKLGALSHTEHMLRVCEGCAKDALCRSEREVISTRQVLAYAKHIVGVWRGHAYLAVLLLWKEK